MTLAEFEQLLDTDEIIGEHRVDVQHAAPGSPSEIAAPQWSSTYPSRSVQHAGRSC